MAKRKLGTMSSSEKSRCANCQLSTPLSFDRLSVFGLLCRNCYSEGARIAYIKQQRRQQQGYCAICNRKLTKKAHLDHEHNCTFCDRPGGCPNCWRGLLCFSCNVGLGNFGDSIRILASAIVYLQDWAGQDLQGPMTSPGPSNQPYGQM